MQTPFAFESVTAVLLKHVNNRKEFHGEDRQPAVDLSFRLEGPNDLLNKLGPELRTALYCNKAATDGQEDIPEVLAVLPNLRNPHLNKNSYTWDKGARHKGYRLVLDYGLGDEQSNEDLEDCTVTGWRFEAKEGGTVVLEWVVQYNGEQLDSDLIGKLGMLMGETVHIQLIPPPTLQVVRGKDKPPADPPKDTQTGDVFADGSPEAALADAA